MTSINSNSLQPAASPIDHAGAESLPALALGSGKPVRLARGALILALCFDWLFVGQRLGVSLLFFTTFLAGGLWWAGRRDGRRPSQVARWLLLPLFFFAAMVAVRSNPFLSWLNVGAVLLLLLLLITSYHRSDLGTLGLVGLWLTPPAALLAAARHGRAPAQAALAQLPGWDQGWRAWLPLLRGLLLALPLLLFLTILLAAADLVFADLITETLFERALPIAFNWSWRALLLLGVAWLLAGGGLLALGAPGPAGAWRRPHTWFRLGWIEAVTVMGLVDLLFGLFVWVQFRYFFGGSDNIDLNGYTYADYARRGFFEIVLVACLTLALILVLNGLTRRTHKRHFRLFHLASTLLLGLVTIMLVSAFQRLALYEAAYGFTRLRVYSHLFMVWLGLVLLWFATTQWRRPEWFARGVLAAALGFLASLNLLNPDAFIVRQNLARLAQAGAPAPLHPAGAWAARVSHELDAGYLLTLSDDAVPALVSGFDAVPPALQEDVAAELTVRLVRYETDALWRRWPARHLGRDRAYLALRSWAQPAGTGGG